MTAKIISGKDVAADIREQIRAEVETLAEKGIQPGLATILIGEDPGSHSYVTAKNKTAKDLGFHSVQETHGDTEHGKHYRLAIALIKAKLGGGDGMFGSVPNCRLIAAAPDLLEALHTIMRQPGFEPDEPYGVQALAAIAKAEGAS